MQPKTEPIEKTVEVKAAVESVEKPIAEEAKISETEKRLTEYLVAAEEAVAKVETTEQKVLPIAETGSGEVGLTKKQRRRRRKAMRQQQMLIEGGAE